MAGKLVLNKNISTSENKILLDVEKLPNGVYFYKIGNLTSKFIKH